MQKVEDLNTDWRCERKFVVENLAFEQVEDFVLGNSYLFKEIHYGRRVNNIYFDDMNHNAFQSNIEGLSERKKYRIRWYGELLGVVQNPVLEAKIKKASLGTKRNFDLAQFKMQRRFDPRIFENVFRSSLLNADVYNELALLSTSLVNSYWRRYYLSWDGAYRLTIDQDILYYYVSPNARHILTMNAENSVVVEIKYAPENDEAVNQITAQFPFRLSRNSKYVKGLSSMIDAVY